MLPCKAGEDEHVGNFSPEFKGLTHNETADQAIVWFQAQGPLRKVGSESPYWCKSWYISVALIKAGVGQKSGMGTAFPRMLCCGESPGRKATEASRAPGPCGRCGQVVEKLDSGRAEAVRKLT